MPDFIGEGTGDQVAINGALCAATKGSFDGVSCVGGDGTATGTVSLLRRTVRSLADQVAAL